MQVFSTTDSECVYLTYDIWHRVLKGGQISFAWPAFRRTFCRAWSVYTISICADLSTKYCVQSILRCWKTLGSRSGVVEWGVDFVDCCSVIDVSNNPTLHIQGQVVKEEMSVILILSISPCAWSKNTICIWTKPSSHTMYLNDGIYFSNY